MCCKPSQYSMCDIREKVTLSRSHPLRTGCLYLHTFCGSQSDIPAMQLFDVKNRKSIVTSMTAASVPKVAEVAASGVRNQEFVICPKNIDSQKSH